MGSRASAPAASLVICLGLEDSGKTTFINSLVFGEPMTPIKTNGWYVMPYHEPQSHRLFDLSEYGSARRDNWCAFYDNRVTREEKTLAAIFFFINNTDTQLQLCEARDYLLQFLLHARAPDVPLVLIHNICSRDEKGGLSFGERNAALQIRQIARTGRSVVTVRINAQRPNPKTVRCIFEHIQSRAQE